MAKAVAEGKIKSAVYENLARIGKSVASPARIEILDLLCQGPRTVEALAVEIGQSVGNTSQHLQVLKRANLVTTQKQGTYVTYFLADPAIGAFVRGLCLLGENQLLEIQVALREFHNRHGDFQQVALDDFQGRLKAGEVTVIDVRPEEEFAAGHLAGAVSMPLPELENRLKKLPKDKEIVAYCRGPYCVMSADAVEMLSKKGFRAYRLEEGVTDFRAAGMRIESEEATA